MSLELKLSPDFVVPIAAITRRIVILGQSDTGKTNTVTDLMEEVLEAGQQTIALDWKGDLWGLRSSANGKSAGYPIVIFGGDHQDVEIDEGSGSTIADAIVAGGFSAIIDFSNFESKASIRRFVTAFSKRLFYQKRNSPSPVLVVLDEVDQYAPQRPFEGEQLMLGAIETLVRLGRKRGIGVAMTTQAPAIVSKNVLEQGDLYIFHQMSGKNAVKAIEDAVRRNASPEDLAELSRGIGRLQRGEAYVYSPSWLRVLKQVKMRKRRTFDSSRTPEVGDVLVTPTARATPDIPALRAQIAATIEKAKADDPKTLRARIVELEREIKHRPAETKQVEKRVDVPIVDEILRLSLESHFKETATSLQAAEAAIASLRTDVDRNSKLYDRLLKAAAKHGIAPGEPAQGAALDSRPTKVQQRSAAGVARGEAQAGVAHALPRSHEPSSPGKGGERATLAVAAQYPGGCTREQLTILTAYKRSTRDAYIQRLRSAGYVETSGPLVVATAAGIEALGSDFEPLPTGDALRSYWLERLPEGEGVVLSVLIEAWPRSVQRGDIDDATTFKRSTRDAYIQRLKARLLIVVGSDGVKASSELFSR